MTKVLKPSARPMIGFAIVSSPILVIIIMVLFRRGLTNDSLKIIGAYLSIQLFFFVLIRGMQITVTDEKITFRQYYVISKSVPFSGIDHSDVQYMAERDHPISITIHKRPRGPALTIPLKGFARADVQWLVKIEGLKVVEHAGFTKRKMRA